MLADVGVTEEEHERVELAQPRRLLFEKPVRRQDLR